MTQVHSLTIDDITNELNLGRATVKFILNRFSTMLPHDRVDGRACYSQDTLSTLIQIKDLMDQGLVPSQIETALADSFDPRKNQIEDVRMSQDALAFIQNLFQDIKTHQSRIARAHEKRAEAEERKAGAIEKRAEAEEKKAQAMNNIAMALQDMNHQRPNDPQALEIAGHAAQALTMNETESLSQSKDAIDLDAGLDDADLSGLFPPPGSGTERNDDTGFDDLELDDSEIDDLGLEDLALEIAEPDQSPPAEDDLNRLVDDVSAPGDGLENLLDDPNPLPDLDELVDTDQKVDDLDDLSSLLEPAETVQAQGEFDKLDDLSALVDTGDDLDDLNSLVDLPDNASASAKDLDDLFLLVDQPAENSVQDLDDLSILIDNGPQPGDMDDLSALMASDAPAEPSLKPDITPEQDMAKYKAAVMKIIMDLKNKGLSAGETTDRLNRDDVPTLSGKPQWREKAIAKIYGFIDSAQ
jgi:DNA-binding transcriptional MerR regulator